MKKVPDMVSTKDLSYICDIFNWNNTMIKKLEFYLNTIEDEEIEKEFKSLKKMHENNCNTLLSKLKGSANCE